MKNKLIVSLFSLSLMTIFIISCQKTDNVPATPILEDFAATNYAYFTEDDLPVHFGSTHFKIEREGAQLTHSSENDAKVTLGRVLFYDNNLSNNGALSCATCHNQTRAFCDGKAVSEGLFDTQTSRSSMSLTNMGFQSRFFWDVTTHDLKEAVMMPIQNHVEMGILDLQDLPNKLNALDYYPALVENAYENTTISEDNIAEALAMFVASIVSYDSKYDKGQLINFSNFTQAELNGKELFEGKALCVDCHKGTQFIPTWRNTASIGLAPDEDTGEFVRSKIPSLRNIQLTAPYMHDGRFETLMDVVNHYDHGVQWHEDLDWTLKNGSNAVRLNLTETEKEDLVAFLETLTDYTFVNDARFSSPFK